MRYVLGVGAVFALVWLPASGCCQPPPPHSPASQFGGYHGAPVQPHSPQSSGAAVQQYSGGTEMPSSQVPGQHQFQPPAGQGPSTNGAEHPAPGSPPTHGP